MEKLSSAACSLWAKKSYIDGMMLWLPLIIHMNDSAAVAEKLWNHWLPQGTKNSVIAEIGNEDSAENLIIFLAAIHDLGKATPVFQSKLTRPPCLELDEQTNERLIRSGMPIRSFREFSFASKTPHALATQILLQNAGCNPNAASIVGAHHGKPPSYSTLNHGGTGAYGFNYHLESEGKEKWENVQQELIRYALERAEFLTIDELPSPHMTSQVLISGLLVMTDWIASNEKYFPYITVEDSGDRIDMNMRIEEAWRTLSLTRPWYVDTRNTDNLYKKRFGFQANALQKIATKIAGGIQDPGIFIVEAPMGIGKTEAALACAEIFAAKTGRQGLYFALPTQATSDGIFPRLKDWINCLDQEEGHSINLAHGKAQFNREFQLLKKIEGSTNIATDEEAGAFVHTWFEGQKKSLLADFVVGTIDQVLMAALKQKHVMLRHLGLAGKVVIIDECHAYDAYMNQYLNRALNWLGAYGVPVIVLSATLPVEKRQSVVNAYLNQGPLLQPSNDPLRKVPFHIEEEPAWAKSRDYPLITHTDASQVLQTIVPSDGQSTTVKIDFLSDESIMSILKDLLSEGGCAGVLLNTVKRSQQFARQLRAEFGEEAVQLFHSRFLSPDRAKKEELLLKELGNPDVKGKRPPLRIVVGTQVLEQSLDIDFDVLITDLCPMDLLLQRIGRLHRHSRVRPEKLKQAKCFVIENGEAEFDTASVKIYGAYLLMRTKALLPSQVCLPTDIPDLVQDVYDDTVEIPNKPAQYDEEKSKWKHVLADKEKRAKDFRLDLAWADARQNLISWLDTDVSNQHSEAAVRDTDESIEVLLVQEKRDGSIHFMPWVEDGSAIPIHAPLDNEMAVALARQRIRLPGILCAPWNIDKTIKEIENSNSMLLEWQKSSWIKGELVLMLDETFTAKLGEYQIRYHQNEGLLYEKEDSVHV